MKKFNQSTNFKKNGFTLNELVAVTAIIALLAAMLLPALANAKRRSQGIRCQNNEKQLALGWAQYANDFKNLPQSTGAFNTPQPPGTYGDGWCNGRMDLPPSWTDPIGSQLIESGVMYPYVNNVQVYRCPADVSTATSATAYPFGTAGTPRVRSVSMNVWVGDDGIATPNGYETQFNAYTDVLRPADTMLTLDENPATINDCNWMNWPGSTTWTDLPAVYHANGSGISWCDGHAEIHLWHDPALINFRLEMYGSPSGVVPQDGGRDLSWVGAHITYETGAISSE